MSSTAAGDHPSLAPTVYRPPYSAAGEHPSSVAASHRAWLTAGRGAVGPGRAGRAGVAAGALAVAAALISAAVIPAAQAQPRDEGRPSDSFLQREREIDQRLRAERDRVAPADARFDWQWGGSLDYYIFHFDDGIQRSRRYQQPGLNIWSRATIDDGAHELFARMKLDYRHFHRGDEYTRRQDWVGPNFDRAWYQIDLHRALRWGADAPRARIRIGRQQVSFGTGYVLDLPLDAAVLDATWADLRTLVLIGRTIASTPNVDRSPAVDSHMNRRFYGVQLAYEGWDKHVPFVYGLWQQDHTDERPQDFDQEYDYDTQYWGAGVRGSLYTHLDYWAEAVIQTGRSFGDGDWARRDAVRAWGWDVGVEYRIPAPLRPRISAEYMFGSGDGDRLESPTSAVGGNRRDRRDSGFVGFGYRDTGIAAAPIVSNLHVWRAGASFKPLERVELLRELELGTTWFLYHKHHDRAAISDFTAQQFAGFVGWEMDYFVNWRISSDLAWTLRWGVFFPGDAYQDRDSRQFLFSGLTWSF
ncbi:MAG: alginate export family protein [Phycisphaerales bacterium]|nr:alginate export family protein [Phycisphaerales bacterium]